MNPERLSKTRASFLARLQQRKIREQSRLFLAQGIKCVGDIAKNHKPVEIISTEEAYYKTDFRGDVKRLIASSSQLKQISTLQCVPEIIGVFEIPEQTDPQIDTNGYNILIDGVQDPGNMGTIIRTCDWFGFHRLFISGDCADVYNPKTVLATMGSLGRVKVWRGDLHELTVICPEMPVLGLLLDGKNIYKADLPGKGFVILGNEGKGISPGLREKVTDRLLIPSFGDDNHAESLNVGVACGITLGCLRNEK